MKSEINKLIKVRDKIIQKVEKRDKVALIRSDDWYQSSKGKQHEAVTGKLADATESIKEAIKELENIA
ncbi:hypothetical protein BZARG_749 [Bizionia argentinensis JUB59]|uniref:Uncharacterized protein n=1 Tax=Bizionia argentinensis JUB59 TaxID=1046627 RepID=G2EB66_9FLAO|nr:hypothetical protein [Bizionia argentinensis]EGV44397.1 hypothetical protein BZARG_749 [Bizionia argentinensis JUB59]